ncbi:MAG: PepSY-associated TM helix domain-containing protein [Acidobacteriota bacterium]
MRAFFRTVEDWHRWLGALPEGRQNARAITGASNLAFLFIVVSGLVLWFPRKWRWQNVRAVLWFRGGLSAKARDFNWHNTAGFWCCVPLFFIVLSGVVMSYPWANDMVYTMNGVKPPQGKGKDKGRAKGGDFNRSRKVSTAGLDSLLAQVEQQNPEWRTITFTAPGSDDAPVTFNVDTGTGGQPQLKSTVTLARETGQLLKSEAFTDQDAGRQARSWMRFMHTGEYYGLTGQTIAGIASLGGALLVWTGFALAYRRFRAWVGRRSAHQQLADKAAA